MHIWYELLSNTVLVSAITAWFVAQVLKTLIDMWYTKGFSIERMWGSGGMPSSHSATVCALMISTAFEYKVSSFEFAISFVLATIVMHDAMGVRRETGRQAKLLNLILDSDFMEIKGIEDFEKRLKEFVGHTPLQVFMGAVLGIIIAVIINMMLHPV